MVWWAWLVVGVILLIVEAGLQTEFWLAMIGMAAIGVGLTGWMGLAGPVWSQWLSFGGLSVLFAVFIRRRIHEEIVGRAPGVAPDLVGDTVTVAEWLGAGEAGSVEHRGTVWRARNVGDAPIVAGGSARVEVVDGLLLEIRG